MRIIKFNNYIEEMPKLIENHNETVIVESNSPCILYGADEFNNPNLLPTYNTHNFGGVIVNFDTDVCVVHCEINGYAFGDSLMNNLVAWLKSKNINAYRDNNDLLVDGYKVASYVSSNCNGVIYSAAHISVKVVLDDIKAICTKPMIKTPKGLSEYGITNKALKAFLNTIY